MSPWIMVGLFAYLAGLAFVLGSFYGEQLWPDPHEALLVLLWPVTVPFYTVLRWWQHRHPRW